MFRGPSRGPCIGSIYPNLLEFGGIQDNYSLQYDIISLASLFLSLSPAGSMAGRPPAPWLAGRRRRLLHLSPPSHPLPLLCSRRTMALGPLLPAARPPLRRVSGRRRHGPPPLGRPPPPRPPSSLWSLCTVRPIGFGEIKTIILSNNTVLPLREDEDMAGRFEI